MDYQVKQVGNHRGKPRLYFQARKLGQHGFAPGTRYSIQTTGAKVTLKVDPQGAYLVSRKEETPVIDINSAETLAPFMNVDAVKVTFGPDTITIGKLASHTNKVDRLARLKSATAAGIAVMGLAFGGGILDNAAHAGMVDAGLQPRTVLVNEIDNDLLAHAQRANPVIDKDTILVSAPMQEVIQDDAFMASVPRADVLVAGIPCSGASKAGKSKNGNTIMEAHPEVGHLAHAFLVFLQKAQPSVFLLENVPEYADSASAQIIRQQARDMGYTTHEVVLDASEFGSMEKRVRWFMVGATTGVQLDLSNLAPAQPPVRTVASILDTHGDHHWGTFQYLKDKAVRDKEAGKGFQMQVVNPTSTRVPTLRKGYHKGGSTDPLLQHPDNADMLRLFSGDEHARIKGVDPKLVAGLSNTDKHIILGQGVCPGPVRAIAQRIGAAILEAQHQISDTRVGLYQKVVG